MQTRKFTLFDYDKLQNLQKLGYDQQIINWANIKRTSNMNHGPLDYTSSRRDNILVDLPPSYYIQRANEIINNKKKEPIPSYIPLKTANEKLLFITTLVFPDSSKFVSTLKQYSIDSKTCLNFSEAIKELSQYDLQKRTAMLELLIQEHFPNLNLIQTHYGTNNTGVIINKILEIAYLHPELLHTKEKS